MPLLRIEKQMADSDCEKADYYPRAGHMKYTRRDFFEAAGAIVAAAGGGCSRRPAAASRVSGATGVELGVEGAALPDDSHALERYLVRLASDARARRSRVGRGIARDRANNPAARRPRRPAPRL